VCAFMFLAVTRKIKRMSRSSKERRKAYRKFLLLFDILMPKNSKNKWRG